MLCIQLWRLILVCMFLCRQQLWTERCVLCKPLVRFLTHIGGQNNVDMHHDSSNPNPYMAPLYKHTDNHGPQWHNIGWSPFLHTTKPYLGLLFNLLVANNLIVISYALYPVGDSDLFCRSLNPITWYRNLFPYHSLRLLSTRCILWQ